MIGPAKGTSLRMMTSSSIGALSFAPQVIAQNPPHIVVPKCISSRQLALSATRSSR
jgi:hypothetical protein